VDNKVTLGNIWINPPREFDFTRRPKLLAWPKYTQWYNQPWHTLSRQLVLPDMPMPGNIKDFLSLHIRFACTLSILIIKKCTFLQLFGHVGAQIPAAISPKFPIWKCQLEVAYKHDRRSDHNDLCVAINFESYQFNPIVIHHTIARLLQC
jgi:hypothetical protein